MGKTKKYTFIESNISLLFTFLYNIYNKLFKLYDIYNNIYNVMYNIYKYI